MKQHRTIAFAILAASLIVSSACSLLPFGPSLPENRRLGDMTIHYPEAWQTERQGDILLISPEEIGDLSEIQPQPVLIAIYGLREDWVGAVVEEPSEILDEIADEIMAESIGSKEAVEGRGTSWLRATAEGRFDLFEEPVVGWLAVAVRGDEFAFVLAVAPETEWEEYEDIFDAMLERIEFN